jgi:hypothetical protein
VWLKRRQAERANAGWQARSKKDTVSGFGVNRPEVSTRTKPGVKHRPTVTKNRPPERSNPAEALD